MPTLAILSLPQWKCPNLDAMSTMTPDEKTEVWQLRMRELSGAIAVSACVQVVIGYTGLVGKLLKIITPLTIVPTVSLVGLTLFKHAGETASKHWGIAVGLVHIRYLLYRFTNCMFFFYFQDHCNANSVFTDLGEC